MRTAALLGVLVMLGRVAAGQPAPGVSAQAAASIREVSIGQPFGVEVRARGPEGTSWTFPTRIADGPVELTAVMAEPPLPPGTWRYAAVAVGLDPLQVPPLRIGYRLPDGRTGTVETAPLPLTLVSLLPKDPQQHQLEDVRPPLGLGIGTAFWVAVAVLGALLGMFLVWLWKRRRPAEVAAPAATVTERPADVEALEALDALGRSDLIAGEDLRGFYIALAEIAKRYLERRLGAPVLEMTSAEAVVFVQGHESARAVAPVLRELTQAADLVKFARAGSALDDARRHLAAARGLVQTVEDGLAPRTQGPTEP